MPRKGYKKPVPTRCPTCDLLLPLVALKTLLHQLSELRVELTRPRPDGDDPGRFARFRVLHVKGMLDMILEDELSFCLGHEKRAAAPKPAGDPSFPEAVVPRKRPGRKPKLQAVSNE
jgi:hypothetical protein